uniref:Lsm14-like N-terminal domain-containing protein n=1 Tax=Ditylenchus dipsaci TaxID=166011 RepID=A0A915DFZ8_9BILA
MNKDKQMQVAAPRFLEVNKTRTAQEPSGMPLVDCCNGYSAYQRTAVELGDPIDFNELKKDYDFDANLALFDKERLAENSPENVRDGRSLIVTKNFRNDENILSDPKRIISWTKAVGSDASASEYVGRLITISCGESGCYQGKVFSVDSEKQSITIERPFKDGMPLSEKVLTLLGSDMRDLKVHDNPVEKALAIAALLNVEGFTASKGWKTNFKHRYGILFKSNQGEAGAIDVNSVKAETVHNCFRKASFVINKQGIFDPHDGDGIDAWKDLQVRGKIEDDIRMEDFLEV